MKFCDKSKEKNLSIIEMYKRQGETPIGTDFASKIFYDGKNKSGLSILVEKMQKITKEFGGKEILFPKNTLQFH